MNDEGRKPLRCSFCGKHEQQVHRMIQGPGVRICNECVQLCMGILDDGFEPMSPGPLDDMPDQLPGRFGISWISTSLGRRKRKFLCPWRCIIIISVFSSAGMKR